jgi:putative drug exporter of the RND superfamily
MTLMFRTLGKVVVAQRWPVLLLWAALLAFGVLFAPRLHEVFEREFVTGNTGDSQAAADLISTEFSNRSAYQQQLVLRSDSLTVDDAEYRRAADALFTAAKGTGLITRIDSYFSTGSADLVSADGRTTYALLNLRSATHSDAMNSSGKIMDAVKDVESPDWLEAYVTGLEASHAEITAASQRSMERAEMIGLPIALMVLVFVFGALVAAGLPLLIGILSIVVALALAFAVGQLMDLSVFLASFSTMIGLGVGIDYSLFTLTRYRAERADGLCVEVAVVETVAHAGKAVAFSGLTVIIGFLALLATGEPTIISIGIGGMLVVSVAVVAALTLLPAALAILGDRIEMPRGLGRLIGRAHRSGFWHRWAVGVMRHPIPAAVAGVAIIGVLAWPALTLKTGSMGVKTLAGDAQSRQGFEVISEEFGAGVVSPVQIAVRSPSGIDDRQTVAGIYHLTQAIARDDRFSGVVSLTSAAPELNLQEYQAMYADDFAGVPAEMADQLDRIVNRDRGGDATVVLAMLPDDPSADSSRAAVRALREEIIPSVPELRNDDVLVGGFTALEMDMTDALYARFPVVIGLILAATFVLLVVLLRSVLIPLKAVLMNLFSVFAAYGLIVLVFQRGVGADLLGFEPVGFVNWVTPVLLFAILFGLSMDYEVFLMSRMRELHDRGYSNEESVSIGLERTGGVITGAAAIMVVVFASFMLSPIIVMKEMGFGLAVAIFVDATLIRVLLAPALMKMMGDWNWWLPRPLERLVLRVEPEGEG